jgi:hypothetical protein
MVVGQIKIPFLSHSITLYSSTRSPSQLEGEHMFSFSLPSQVNIDGSTLALPPSFYAYHPGTSTEIKYTVNVDMARKGWRRHEK